MPAPVVVSTPAPVPSMAVEACARMVDAAAKSCTAPGAQPVVAQPNWDGMATAIAQQSNAIAFGGVVLTVIFFVAGFSWGRIITGIAAKAAKEEANRYAEQWLKEEAPTILRQISENISGTTLADGNGNAAEDIGIKAGD